MPGGGIAQAAAPDDDALQACVAAIAALESGRGEAMTARMQQVLRLAGLLGSPAPCAYGGGGLDMVTYGLATAEIGRVSSAARTMLTVHNLVVLTLVRWGSPALKSGFLPQLATGAELAAVAISELGAGSDIQAISTRLERRGDRFILNGRKAWTSFGAVADWALVFAQSDGGPVAALVDLRANGTVRHRIEGFEAIEAGGMADLEFEDCEVAPEQLVGRPGFGLSHVAATALDHGRYSVAWGAVGLAEICLTSVSAHLRERQQFGGRMADLPLIQGALAKMAVEVRAARQLCLHAGRLRDAASPRALPETLVAKYFASKTAAMAANETVRLYGARALTGGHPAGRWLRDAKALEIIEGGHEVIEQLIARQLTSGIVHV